MWRAIDAVLDADRIHKVIAEVRDVFERLWRAQRDVEIIPGDRLDVKSFVELRGQGLKFSPHIRHLVDLK